MSISLSDASLKTYKQLLPASLAIMKKAEKHFTDKNIDLNELAEMRLVDDMASLTFQVISIVHNSNGSIDEINNGEFAHPKIPENLNFNDILTMLEDSERKLNHLSDEEIDSLSGKDVMFRMGQIEWAFTAENFVLSFSLPNFYFHVTTMYDMLRIKGLDIGKLDFAGALRIKE